MHNEIKVSIVVPVYNRVTFVDELFNSIIANHKENHEVIFIDNCSSDGTYEKLVELVKFRKNFILLKNNQNIGPVNNWYKCIEKANGIYVKILFSDDLIIQNDSIEQMSSKMDDDVAFVASSVKVGVDFNNSDTRYRSSFFRNYSRISSKIYIKQTLLNFGVLVSPSAALFRRKDLIQNFRKTIKYSDEAFEYYGAGPDLLLFLITAHHYKNVIWINKPLFFFRIHENSASIVAKNEKLFDIKLSYLLTKIWFAQQYGYMDCAKILKSLNWNRLKSLNINLKKPDNIWFLISFSSFLYRFPISLLFNK